MEGGDLFVNVDDTGIEPVTPTMSMWCSTAEPIVLRWSNYTTANLASEIVLDTLNIIFAKVRSGLNLNKDNFIASYICDPM